MARNSIIYTNSRSILNKLNDLALILNEFSPTILCLTETWLGNDYPTTCLPLQDYDVYRKDRNLTKGGVLIAVEKDIFSKEINFSAGELEVMAIDLRFKTNDRI